MKSFRLYVGERKYLTAAGWAALGVAVAVTCLVGYLGAAPLTDALGPNWVWRVVAGSGLLTWLLALGLFRLAGVPLVAEVEEQQRQN